jgi:hypothetical protein
MSLLGIDRTGNNNHWTVNNMTVATDQMLDSPTNSFATWNPVGGENSLEISEGNLKTVNVFGGSTGWNNAPSSTFEIPKTGKWYFEFIPLSTNNTMWAGLSTPANVGGAGVVGWQVAVYQQKIHLEGTGYVQTGLPVIADGSIVAYSLDRTAQTVQIKVNNVNYGTSVDISTLTEFLSDNIVVRLAGGSSGTACSFVANFGQDSSFAGNKTAQGNADDNGYGDFYYAPPTGYLALCTQNLPEPTVVPSEHFNTMLYTGNGGTQSITGVGFQPDFVWLKNRSNTADHALTDAVRGATKTLRSSSIIAEFTSTAYLASLDTDGFSLGSSQSVNASSQTYAAWNWKANGSGSSNTVGDINSTVSANVDAGFSIVSYTGNDNGTTNTIGHGLSQAPELVFSKRRNTGGYHWMTGYNIDGTDHSLYLNSTYAADNELTRSPQAFTATTFRPCSIGSNPHSNGIEPYIAYCFHSVEGYSKVGSYTGNGSSDGSFVYTGFRPAYVMIKNSSNATYGYWHIFDAKRDTYNLTENRLEANTSDAEAVASSFFLGDFASNGFKVRNSNSHINASGSTYIYLAFAEHPFKYTNAR